MAWTTPRTWTPGELVTALMMNQHVRDNLNDLNGRAGVSYVPVWGNAGTANTLGNGSISGTYWRMGQFVFFRVILSWGSTTASGSLGWTFTLPPVGSDGFVLGAGCIGYSVDSSAGLTYPANCQNVSLTTILLANNVSPITGIASGSPFVWANGDVLSILGWYLAI